MKKMILPLMILPVLLLTGCVGNKASLVEIPQKEPVDVPGIIRETGAALGQFFNHGIHRIH